MRFIQRAQRLGFSLEDISKLLQNLQAGNLDDDTVLDVAQQRYFELERQMTQSLVLQHELGLFWRMKGLTGQDLDMEHTLNQFLERACAIPPSQPDNDTFEWLLAQSGCTLNSPAGRELLTPLQGQHTHIWQQEDSYHILIVSKDEKIGKALEDLADLEAECSVHAHQHNGPQFDTNDEGYLLIVREKMHLSMYGFS